MTSYLKRSANWMSCEEDDRNALIACTECEHMSFVREGWAPPSSKHEIMNSPEPLAREIQVAETTQGSLQYPACSLHRRPVTWVSEDPNVCQAYLQRPRQLLNSAERITISMDHSSCKQLDKHHARRKYSSRGWSSKTGCAIDGDRG